MSLPAEALLPFIFGSGGGGGGSSQTITDYVASIGALGTVTLGTTWTGSDPYTSTVTVTGCTATEKTLVNILPDPAVVEQMQDDGITEIYITNNSGTLTATAVGGVPTQAITLNVLCTESDFAADIDEITRHLNDLEDSISDAYDETASYAVGDFCINENTLYRCNTAIPTGGEAWTPAHWDAVQIVDLLGTGGGDVIDVQINGTSIVNEQGVANIPRATDSTEGAVKVYEEYGVKISNGVLFAANPSLNEIKRGVLYKPPSAQQLHQATFYGLAKAAGDTTQSASANAVGAYTEDAKSAIHEMLNGAVTVSGTTPTIAAKSGITYICGEVATLDITPPASGIFEVQFVSGSTPTVLTATGVSWANGFDPTALEANKTYDISISNGIGVAVWI